MQSFRDNLLPGIPYEVVLVDGGSTDGTIEWAKAQPDVKLIEDGKLVGAISAFTRGAFAASGKYVLLANDDITFGPVRSCQRLCIWK
jgi:GT2 family glycosyltransferase